MNVDHLERMASGKVFFAKVFDVDDGPDGFRRNATDKEAQYVPFGFETTHCGIEFGDDLPGLFLDRHPNLKS